MFLSFLFSFILIFFNFNIRAQELTLNIDISSEYNDNIYGREMKEDDVINRISPGIMLRIPHYHKELILDYHAGFEFYVKNSNENTVTHTFNGEANYQPTEHFILRLSESYTRSHSLAEIDIYGIRRERIPYWQNRLNPSFSYQFGERNTFELGYEYNILRYTEVGYERENSDEHSVILNLNYGLTKRGSLILGYTYTYGEFLYYWGILRGHLINIGYNWSLSPHTVIMLTGNYAQRHYSLATDYKIYQILLGIEKSITPRVSTTLQGGYFLYHPTTGTDSKGFSGSALITYSYEHSQLRLVAEKGYREMLFTVLNLGFSTYWQVSLDFRHTFTPYWSVNMGGSYRESKYQYFLIKDKYWSTYVSLDWTPRRWFHGQINYQHENLDTTGFYENYDINRIMLSFRLIYQ